MLARVLLGSAAIVYASSAPHAAHAQACTDDDGGVQSDDDGGMCSEPDSGMNPIDMPDGSISAPPDGGADAGRPDASIDIGDACSCETAEGSDQGVIHVCTGSQDPTTCASFTCESARVRYRPCDTSDVKLCCDMRSRDLYSQLYNDCTHPNCEAGFRAQCTEFGGSITDGPCDIEQHDTYRDEYDDDSGGCSVSGVGSRATAPTWLLLIVGLAFGAQARNRSRRELE